MLPEPSIPEHVSFGPRDRNPVASDITNIRKLEIKRGILKEECGKLAPLHANQGCYTSIVEWI
jgi:hypothetical protein